MTSSDYLRKLRTPGASHYDAGPHSHFLSRSQVQPRDLTLCDAATSCLVGSCPRVLAEHLKVLSRAYLSAPTTPEVCPLRLRLRLRQTSLESYHEEMKIGSWIWGIGDTVVSVVGPSSDIARMLLSPIS